MRHIPELEEEYKQIQQWHKVLSRVAYVLEPEQQKTSKSVEKDLETVLRQMEIGLKQEKDIPFIENVKSYSRGFWKGLFTCYDHPFFPRTNNELELFFEP